MKAFIAALITITCAVNAVAADIKCQVDNITKEDSEKDVPVAIIGANQMADAKEVKFEGSKVSVTVRKGDAYEPQSLLQMQLDNVVSTVRNVNRLSAYELDKGNIRFQCWFEDSSDK